MLQREYEELVRTTEWYWWHTAKRLFVFTFLTKHAVFQAALYASSRWKVLDLGCGVGSNFDLLRQLGEVWGLDKSLYALKYAKKEKYAELRLADANKLPYRKEVFSLIACFDVLYHRDVADEKVLSEVRRTLKTDGWLIVTDCVDARLWSQHDENNFARERYEPAVLLSKITESGFEIIDWSHLFMITYPLFVLSRIWGKIHHAASEGETKIPIWLNEALFKLAQIEAWFLKYVHLPIGSSVVVLARKKV